jgi:hypothetical protein
MSLVNSSRKRTAAMVAVAAEILAAEQEAITIVASLLRPERLPCLRKYNWETQHLQSEKWFYSHFRVGRAVFGAVVDRLSSLAVFQSPVCIGARAITIEKQFAIFLKRFTNEKETYFQVADWFDVGNSTVRAVTMRVAHAIIEAFPNVVHLAKSGPQKDEEMRAFLERGWPHCRGIIDCTDIPIVPDAQSVRRGCADEFMNRSDVPVKRYQCIVAADLRFIDICGGNGGKTQDQTIFDNSEVVKVIGEYLGPSEWFMADMGYKLLPYCISGFRAKEIAGHEFANFRAWFNRYFSSTRITVERAFGVLKGRFRSLLSGLFFRNQKEYSVVFLSLCILHNICIEYRDEVDPLDIAEAMAKEHTTKAARKREAEEAVVPPATHANNLAAGRVRRDQIAAYVGGAMGH